MEELFLVEVSKEHEAEALHHHLTDELLCDGGSSGCGICPSERGKGYGTR